MRAIGTPGDHANGQLAHMHGLAGPDAADATTLTVRRARHVAVAILARTTHLAHRPTLIWGSQRLDRTATGIHEDRRQCAPLKLRTISEREPDRRLPEEQDPADDAHAQPGLSVRGRSADRRR